MVYFMPVEANMSGIILSHLKFVQWVVREINEKKAAVIHLDNTKVDIRFLVVETGSKGWM